MAAAGQGKRISVLIDIDETLVYFGGSLIVPGLVGSYRLAHGALEFLVALDKIPQVRIGFFSAGIANRNRKLLDHLSSDIKATAGHELRSFDLFSLSKCRPEGKKQLKGLREDLDIKWTVLIDDLATNSAPGEEQNLLKVYGLDSGDAGPLLRLRRDNNLVRALGMILICIDMVVSSGCSLVKTLDALQWDGSRYRHEETNSPHIYARGLAAMKVVTPNFSIIIDKSLGPAGNLASEAAG